MNFSKNLITQRASNGFLCYSPFIKNIKGLFEICFKTEHQKAFERKLSELASVRWQTTLGNPSPHHDISVEKYFTEMYVKNGYFKRYSSFSYPIKCLLVLLISFIVFYYMDPSAILHLVIVHILFLVALILMKVPYVSNFEDNIKEAYLRRRESIPVVIKKLKQELVVATEERTTLLHCINETQQPTAAFIKDIARNHNSIMAELMDETQLRKFWELVRDQYVKDTQSKLGQYDRIISCISNEISVLSDMLETDVK